MLGDIICSLDRFYFQSYKNTYVKKNSAFSFLARDQEKNQDYGISAVIFSMEHRCQIGLFSVVFFICCYNMERGSRMPSDMILFANAYL